MTPSTPSFDVLETFRHRHVNPKTNRKPPSPKPDVGSFSSAILKLAKLRRSPNSPSLALSVLREITQSIQAVVFLFDRGSRKLIPSYIRGREGLAVSPSDSDAEILSVCCSRWEICRNETELAIPLRKKGKPLGVLYFLKPKVYLPESLLTSFGDLWLTVFNDFQNQNLLQRQRKELIALRSRLHTLSAQRELSWSRWMSDVSSALLPIQGELHLLNSQAVCLGAGTISDSIYSLHHHVNRLAGKVNDLILASRLQRGKLTLDATPFGLRALLLEVVGRLSNLALEQTVTLKIEDSREHYIQGNQRHLHSSFYDLLRHCIFRAADGESITISLNGSPHQTVTVDIITGRLRIHRTHLSKPSLLDTPSETCSRNTSPPEALRACSETFDWHLGRLDIRQMPKSSCLRIQLPMFAELLVPRATVPKQGIVFVMMEDVDWQSAVKAFLEGQGFQTLTLRNKPQALRQIEAVKPALVFLDFQPNAKDALQLLRHIRRTAHLAEIPVFGTSADRRLSSLCFEPGLQRLDGFLKKPLQLDRLIDVISNHVVRRVHA